MPERVYLNRIPGQQRIHIELTADEIRTVLDDFHLRPDVSAASVRLHSLLAAADAELSAARTRHIDSTGEPA